MKVMFCCYFFFPSKSCSECTKTLQKHDSGQKATFWFCGHFEFLGSHLGFYCLWHKHARSTICILQSTLKKQASEFIPATVRVLVQENAQNVAAILDFVTFGVKTAIPGDFSHL